MQNNRKSNPSVIIIGAGMTGIQAAIKLREAGITNITVLEKRGSVGGTWRENTYPGVACDVPSHMYSYSFEPNPSWTRMTSPGAEIRAYFENVSDKYGINSLVRFNEEVTSTEYIDKKWQLTTSKGDTLSSDFVICATGILHKPAYPDIKGLKSFQNPCFHTARWDHGVNLQGKRVGVIGTGSTSAQVVSELVKDAESVSVFQRTPQWYLPSFDYQYSQKNIELNNRFPIRTRIARGIYSQIFSFVFSRGVIGHKLPRMILDKSARWHLRLAVKNPVLRDKLRPDYNPGCKRLVISSDFYSAVQKPNCNLVTGTIDEVQSNGIKTSDGTLHTLDALVLATGFDNFSYMRPIKLKGESGIDINHAWAKKIETYRSMFIPGFPNFFLMLGPNSPIGNTSLIQLSEVQTDYIIKMIEHWKAGAVDEIKPRVSAVKAFQHAIKQSMSNTVWVGGCKSWYLDGSGTPALWPWTMERWYKEMKTPNLADFVLPNNMTANEEYGNYIGSLQKEAALAEELEIAV